MDNYIDIDGTVVNHNPVQDGIHTDTTNTTADTGNSGTNATNPMNAHDTERQYNSEEMHPDSGSQSQPGPGRPGSLSRTGTCDEIRIDGSTTYSRSLLQTRIEMDSYEFYLFIQCFVQQVSDVWSPLMLVLFISTIVFYALAVERLYSESFSNPIDTFARIWLLVFFFFTSVFPIYCMAYANEAMNTIRDCFHRYSTPNNYNIIGGRDVWINYLEESPAYWTVYGTPLTWGSMYSLIGSIFGSLTVIGATYMTTKNHTGTTTGTTT